MLSDLTDPQAIFQAIAEYDELGRDAFLRKYGFGRARRYFLVHDGGHYDSKAIVGVAHRLQHPDEPPVTAAEFSGGEASVVPILERLGFTVIEADQAVNKGPEAQLPLILQEICDLLTEREAGSKDFSPERLTTLVRLEAASALRSLTGSRAEITGRTGIGTAADVPWVGLFPPGSEGSAQEGFFLVYLFAMDGSGVYLSLNQGTEQVRGGLEVLRKRALDLRRVVGAQADLLADIDLKSTNSRPRKYEAGSAYAILYGRANIPCAADVIADLERMLSLLDQAVASGLRWDPELEALHLVFKWNADVEPRTVDLHREIAEREGSVWWGRFSNSPTPSISQTKLDRLTDQVEKEITTHAYLYRRGMCWRANLRELRVNPPPVADQRLPAYYSPAQCNLFARLDTFVQLDPSWLTQNAVLASHPDADPQRLGGAMSNQTTPLFIYELAMPSDTIADLQPSAGGVDISAVTLSDVCDDVAVKMRAAGLDYGSRHRDLVRAAIVSLATKRFLILTGLSGSGKTRLGIAVGQWFGADRLKVVPVRPDWTGPDALLGFENGLSIPLDGRHAWIVPDTLEFVLRAASDQENPYLLLLDEMNLAHVERYFADVLSGMESQSPVVPNLRLSGGEWRLQEPIAIPFPTNLFVVGTVNIDETTYMFSPKVLDRANTIEFRVLSTDLQAGALPPIAVEPGEERLVRRFMYDSTTIIDDDWPGRSQLGDWLRDLHVLLLRYDREFGHRVFFEALRFGSLLSDAGEEDPRVALDLQVMQKILPRFHGSIRQVADPLHALGDWCFHGPGVAAAPSSFDPLKPPEGTAALPVSFNKIQRMARRLRSHHFVGFAE